MSGKAKVIVVGFDGATFSIADPLMRAGQMPNLSALCSRGCRAVLESTTPWLSPPAWITMMTGLNPGRHGIFNFTRMQPDLRSVPLPSFEIKGGKLWSILNSHGLKTGVVNVPMTYPADPVDGFMISGLPGAGIEVHPESRRPDLERTGYIYQYNVQLENDYIVNSRDLTAARVYNDACRAKAALSLADMEPDFLMVVFSATDELQHTVWHGWDTTHPANANADMSWETATVPLAYINSDRYLGEIVARYAGPETYIFVVSDHGFGPARWMFFPNNLLADWGYLTPGGPAPGDPLAGDENYSPAKLGFDPARTKSFMGPAIIGPFGEMYLNVKGRNAAGTVGQGDEYARLRGEIAARFLEWRDPVTGVKPVTAVHMREDLYDGPYAEYAPDFLIESDYCRIQPTVREYPAVTRCMPWHMPTKGQTGMHARDGIIVAAGPGIRQGADCGRLRIVDTMPTIMYCMGPAQPAGLDGRVMDSLFRPEHLGANPVRIGERGYETGDGRMPAPDAEETAAMTDVLRGLGYFE